MNNNIKKIIFLIISSFTILSYFIIFLSFDNYFQIDYSDHDEGFLLEQLILKLNYPNFNQNISSIAEYGIDFFYFKYFFLLLSNIFQLEFLLIYKIKTLINALVAVIGLVFLYKIFNLLKINIFFYYLFLISIISVPEFFFLTISLKPDLNLVFCFLNLTLYYFFKSLDNKSVKYIVLFLFFLALSLSIKATAIPFLVLLFINKFIYLVNIRKNYKLLYSLIIIITILFINLYLYELNNFVGTSEDLISFISRNNENKLLTILIFILSNYFYLILFFVNSLIIFIIYITKNRFNFFSNIIFFLSTLFLILYPFISDFNIFFKTIIEHSHATILNSNSSSYKNYENIISYIFYDIVNFKINISILIIFLISPIFILLKKKKFVHDNKNLSLFYLTYSCFLFINLVSDYAHHYPSKYLYFIYINLFVYNLVNIFLLKNNYFKSLTLIMFFPLIFNLNNNYEKYFNFYNYIFLTDITEKIIKKHNDEIEFKNKKLILCSASYPINYYNNKFKKITTRLSNECLDKEFIIKLNNNEIILLDNDLEEIDKSIFLKEKLKLIYKDKVSIIGRFGNKINKYHYFYIKE